MVDLNSMMESNQASLTLKTTLLLPTVLGAPSERQSPDSLWIGRVPRDFLHQDWEILSSRGVSAVFYQKVLGGRWGTPLLGRPRRIL